MEIKKFPRAVAYSLGAHGLALAMLVISNATTVAPRQTIENVSFITASLIYAMNGHDDQKILSHVNQAADRTVRNVNKLMEPHSLIDQANNAEYGALATEGIREEQKVDNKADVSVSLHLPILMNVDNKEIAPLGKTSADHPDVGRRSGSSRAESGQMVLPRYLNASRPAYPVIARMRGYEGMVLLAVEVLTDGHAGEVRIKKSSGYALLDQSALNAVRAWRFEPARKRNMPLAMTVDIPIRFSLKEVD
ncbi:MAG: energy transducer TonB [Pseudomonadota bacterium]